MLQAGPARPVRPCWRAPQAPDYRRFDDRLEHFERAGAHRLAAEADAVRRATAELPETRSEPPTLRCGQSARRVDGAERQPNAFDQDTVTCCRRWPTRSLSTGERALAAESQVATEAMRRAAGESSVKVGARSCARNLCGRPQRRRRVDVVLNAQVQGDWPNEAQRALQEGGSSTPRAHAIKRARHSGQGAWQRHRRDRHLQTIRGSTWTPEEIALAETLADQLGTALESARLYRTRSAAPSASNWSAKSRPHARVVDMEAVLKTAVQEIGERLGLHDIASS